MQQPFAEKREEYLGLRIGKVMRFQRVRQFVDGVHAGDHAGDDDQRPRLGGKSGPEIIARKATRRQPSPQK